MKLTQENFKTFVKSIKFENLTKTFKDAITAARNLGFQYLWVSRTFSPGCTVLPSGSSAMINNYKVAEPSDRPVLMSK